TQIYTLSLHDALPISAVIRHMHLTGAEIMEGLRELMSRYDHDGIVQGMGPMFQLYFTAARKIQNYRHTLQSDFEKFRKFRNLMRSEEHTSELQSPCNL